MRTQYSLLTAAAVLGLAVFMTGATMAQDDESVTTPQHSSRFIDADGDGYNDNAPDADGDGIPNGQDPDYVRPENAPGQMRGHGFVDADGDGFNDNASDLDGDGIPNGRDADYVRPGDGSGRQLGRSGNEARTRNMSAKGSGAQRGSLLRNHDRLQDGTGAGTGEGAAQKGVRQHAR